MTPLPVMRSSPANRLLTVTRHFRRGAALRAPFSSERHHSKGPLDKIIIDDVDLTLMPPIKFNQN